MTKNTLGRLGQACTGMGVALLLAGLAGCATAPGPLATGDGWHAVALPGKRATDYFSTTKEGRPAVAAVADRSASMWRRKVDIPPERLGEVSLSWWVENLIHDASISDVAREDAVARVIFAFDGDTGRLSARNRAMFDLARALTGEAPPYATLMYVWETKKTPGTVVVNPRSDRIRKIVLDSGAAGLRSWREHRRDLAADFRLAFGEDPGRLVGIAVMTDGDNTGSRARTWYGPIEVRPPLRPTGISP